MIPSLRPPALAALLLATACQAEPIEIDSADSGASDEPDTTTVNPTQSVDDGDGAGPSPTLTGVDDDGGVTNATATSGPWGGDTGVSSATDGGDDGPGATTGAFSPCSGDTQQECADSAMVGVSCAYLPAYYLDSDASCTFEAIGELCVEIIPADEGCQPTSCADTASRYHTQENLVVELGTCTAIVGYDPCVPGSPNTACACACVSGLPGA